MTYLNNMETENKEIPKFIISVEGKEIEVYTHHINGLQLKNLAGIQENEELFISVSGPYEDELVVNDIDILLTRPEIEYFYKRRELKFTINGTPFKWVKQYITGEAIRKSGGIDPEHDLFLEVQKPYENERIHNDTRVDLARPGIEHFISKAPDKDFVIIVNGREKIWNENQITFEQVVELAFGRFENTVNRVYTVTYSRGKEPKPEGTMIKGSKVDVKNKMVFNVTATDKS